MTPNQRIHQHETANRALTSHTAQQTAQLAQLAQFCNYMASPHPNTIRGDIAYWRLTPAEASHYAFRLTGMHADRATHHAALAARYADQTERGAWAAYVLVAIAITLGILSEVLR